MTSNAHPTDRRLDELEARIAALEAQMPPPDPVLVALTDAFGGRVFTSALAIGYARRQREAAEAIGLRPPPLPAALAEARLTTARQLGIYLARHENHGVVRIGTEAGGLIWSLVASRGADTIRDDQLTAARR